MELIIYLIGLVSSLSFGILTIRDRIFGIIGAMIAWLTGLYMMNEASLITIRVYNSSTSSWLGYSIPFQQIELLAIILGLFGVVDIFIVIASS